MLSKYRKLAAELKRSPEQLVPPAFQFLFERQKRYIVPYGGRSSAKSWSVARVLLQRGTERKHLILCARESQSSIKESAYRLLCDQIRALELEDFYSIGADRIVGTNGTEFIFEGLYRNAERLKSYEGITIVWVEEAHRVSERSWEDLIPTVRKAGSQFFITFNPSQADDPVWQRFIASMRPDVLARRVTWRDNPFLSAETIAEKDWCAATDIDQFRHVWEGEFRTVTEAQILRGKYVSQMFDVNPGWSGPYYGLDFGFSQDPTAGTVCYIDDDERVLYIRREFWKLGADIDALPDALEAAMPGVSGHTLYCDSARPESISYIARHGVSGARPAEKWPGSIDDGISYLRSFSKIVIHPECVHTLDEANRYNFKVDRLTGNPLPEVQDKHNHCIDSIRYGLSPLIRNQPTSGYFNRAALLVKGEPLVPPLAERPLHLMLTLASDGRVGAGVGLIYWAVIPYSTRWQLIALAYDLAELEDAYSAEWLQRTLARAEELRAAYNVPDPTVRLHIEEGELLFAVASAVEATAQLAALDVCAIETKQLPPTIDERAAGIRLAVNGGRVKLGAIAYGAQVTYRAVTTNHLTAQLFAFRPGTPDAPHELVQAFCLGAKFALGDAAALPPDPDQEPAPSPEQRAAEQARSDIRRTAMEQYARELAEWEAKRTAAIAALREKFGPAYVPRSLIALGIGPPPVNPNAGHAITPRNS